MVRRNNRSRNNKRKPRRNQSSIRGSTTCMPYQQYVRGNASLSAGNNFVTYSVSNLFSDLSSRVVFPTHFIVKFQPIFPTGTTPGTNIIYAQLQFRSPVTLTDVPGTTVKLLSQTNSTRLSIRLPTQSSGWFASSNTSVILSLYINTTIACNLDYEIDTRGQLARDSNT